MVTPEFHTTITRDTQDRAEFALEPLMPSFASSMGNALRRSLLSAIPGMAITAVKVVGVEHMFSTIPGIKESVLDIILNLKSVRFVPAKEGTYELKLKSKGMGEITAESLEGELEIVNKDLHIAELTAKTASLEVECIVSTGYGFVSSEEQTEIPTGFTAIDASFSPVKLVNYKVETARVGRKSNYEKLIIDVQTDGTITPEASMTQAREIIVNQFNHFMSGSDEQSTDDAIKKSVKAAEVKSESKVLETIIDELNLPSRVINALLRENIETVDDLLKRGRNELVVLKGVGRKSIDLIEEELNKLGVTLE